MSERKFNVGDRVRIKEGMSRAHGGVVTVITAGPMECGPSYDGYYPGAACAYEVDLPTVDPRPDIQKRWPRAVYSVDRLEPYYDGNEKVSWSTCVWQPKQVSA